MNRTIIFDYLELACHGMAPIDISCRHGLDEHHLRASLLKAARHVSRLGFWKFHIAGIADLYANRGRLLAKMQRHGLVSWGMA